MYSTLSSSTRRPARPPHRQQQSLNHLWSKLAVAALAVAAVAAVVGGLIAIQKPASIAAGKVLVIQNLDADVAGNGLQAIAPLVQDAANDLAAHHGGTLQIITAAGGAATTVATTDLKVEREGQEETVPQVREAVVAQRVSDAFAMAQNAAAPGEPGRNILSLLTAAAQAAPPPGEPFTVFYVGFGLGTVDPTDARVMLAGEPGQAVQSIAPRWPKLPGAQLRVVFPPAAGSQPALNVATMAWRDAYWRQLAAATGATLTSITTDLPQAPATPGATDAPVVDNIPDSTPVPPCTPNCTTTTTSGPPPPPPTPDPAPVKLGSGTFLPDSDQFADPAAVDQELGPMIAAWNAHPGGYLGAECVGRTSAIGPADGARLLSQQRADRAAELLRSAGISVKSTGVGFDDPLTDYPPTDAHQRSVICSLILADR